MNTSIYGFPLWLVVTLGIVLISFVIYLIVMAMREGREVSFWPPRIGQKPKDETKQSKGDKKKENSGQGIDEDGADNIHPLVMLPSTPIWLLNITSGPKQANA